MPSSCMSMILRRVSHPAETNIAEADSNSSFGELAKRLQPLLSPLRDRVDFLTAMESGGSLGGA